MGEVVNRVIGNIQLCWNPKCHYAHPLGSAVCTKCGWTAAGPPSLPKEIIAARAVTTPRERGMNKTEARYERHLREEQQAGRISGYKFESVKLRLADNTFLTMDFIVIDCDGMVQFHDTKALWKSTGKPGVHEDYMVKVKVASETYPWFEFRTTWEENGIWKHKIH